MFCVGTRIELDPSSHLCAPATVTCPVLQGQERTGAAGGQRHGREDEILQPRSRPIALLTPLAFSSICFAKEEIQSQSIPGGTEADEGIPGGV